MRALSLVQIEEMCCEDHCGLRSARQVCIWRSVWRGRMQGNHLLRVDLADKEHIHEEQSFHLFTSRRAVATKRTGRLGPARHLLLPEKERRIGPVLRHPKRRPGHPAEGYEDLLLLQNLAIGHHHHRALCGELRHEKGRRH